MSKEIFSKLFDLATKVTPVGNARVVAACLDKKGNILSIGTNKRKSHPTAALFHRMTGKPDGSIFLHAEMDAILQLGNVPKGAAKKIVVVRAKKTRPGGPFVPGKAEPCLACRKAIEAAGIENIEWSIDTPAFKDYLLSERNV